MSRKKKSERYFLPEGYKINRKPSNYDDRSISHSKQVHQPEVYRFLEYLSRALGRNKIFDIGCGVGKKISSGLVGCEIVGIDQKSVREQFLSNVTGSVFIEVDLETIPLDTIPESDWTCSILICADVLEHIKRPDALLRFIAHARANGAIVIVSTPDRRRLHRGEHLGPPVNTAHVREWCLSELELLFQEYGCPFLFAGWSVSDNFLREKSTFVGVSYPVDRNENVSARTPLGIVSCYNDADVIEAASVIHLNEGIDLHFIDNWSDDGTYEILEGLCGSYPGRISLERFPSVGPGSEYNWVQILDRKAAVAAKYPGRWIIHIDSDEIRLSPWQNLSLRDAFKLIETIGFNAADFCVVEFPPVVEGFDRDDCPLTFFKHFKFARHPGHFLQRRAWLQPSDGGAVDLSQSGGHNVEFSDRRVCPFRFLLLHYPVRSSAQGKRKVFLERRPRFSAKEVNEFGWHNHYDHIHQDHRFLVQSSLLNEFDLDSFRKEYLLEILSDVVLQRSRGGLVY